MTRIRSVAIAVVACLVLGVLALGAHTGAIGFGPDRLLPPDAGPHLPPEPTGPRTPSTDLSEQEDDAGPSDRRPDPREFDHGDGAPGIFTAAPGDCLVSSDDTRVVPCDHPHEAEVYYTFTVEETEFPHDGFDTEACLERFGAYVGTTVEASGYGLTWLVPSPTTWEDAGDREVICLLTSSEPTTGSAFRSAELVA